MDEVTAKLTTIFEVVKDWLKYAETKNAVFLAFAGAGMTAIITFLSTAQTISNSLRIGSLLAISLLCVCTLVCALSFLPRTNLERLLWMRGKPSKNPSKRLDQNDNLYYFGHLQKYQPIELLEALNKYYFEGKIQTPYKKEYEDLTCQITINSEITSLKLKFFNFALYFLIASIFAIPISIITSLIFYRSL